MPGFSFQSYERVPGVGDEDYNHNDPLQRAAATEQRTRDYFVRLLPTSYIIHNNLVLSKRQGHAHGAWLRAQSLTASLLSPGQVTVEVAKIAREKLRVNSAPENALVSFDAIPAAARLSGPLLCNDRDRSLFESAASPRSNVTVRRRSTTTRIVQSLWPT